MLVADTIARLKSALPDLTVVGALELARVTAAGGIMARGVTVYVMPGGIAGGVRVDMSGYYSQRIERLTTLILAFASGNAAPLPELDRIEPFIEDILTALTGWDAPGSVGSMSLRRVAPLAAQPGTTVYEITFATPFDLRNTTS